MDGFVFYLSPYCWLRRVRRMTLVHLHQPCTERGSHIPKWRGHGTWFPWLCRSIIMKKKAAWRKKISEKLWEHTFLSARVSPNHKTLNELCLSATLISRCAVTALPARSFKTFTLKLHRVCSKCICIAVSPDEVTSENPIPITLNS